MRRGPGRLSAVARRRARRRRPAWGGGGLRGRLGWGRRSLRVTVGVGTRLFCRHSLDAAAMTHSDRSWAAAYDVGADETAAILFTSGSTGPAKGAVYTHGAFATQVEALQRLFDI